jgi:hypothetical protein
VDRCSVGTTWYPNYLAPAAGSSVVFTSAAICSNSADFAFHAWYRPCSLPRDPPNIVWSSACTVGAAVAVKEGIPGCCLSCSCGETALVANRAHTTLYLCAHLVHRGAPCGPKLGLLLPSRTMTNKAEHQSHVMPLGRLHGVPWRCGVLVLPRRGDRLKQPAVWPRRRVLQAATSAATDASC